MIAALKFLLSSKKEEELDLFCVASQGKTRNKGDFYK